jgi:hypothetical protein
LAKNNTEGTVIYAIHCWNIDLSDKAGAVPTIVSVHDKTVRDEADQSHGSAARFSFSGARRDQGMIPAAASRPFTRRAA